MLIEVKTKEEWKEKMEGNSNRNNKNEGRGRDVNGDIRKKGKMNGERGKGGNGQSVCDKLLDQQINKESERNINWRFHRFESGI